MFPRVSTVCYSGVATWDEALPWENDGAKEKKERKEDSHGSINPAELSKIRFVHFFFFPFQEIWFCVYAPETKHDDMETKSETKGSFSLQLRLHMCVWGVLEWLIDGPL